MFKSKGFTILFIFLSVLIVGLTGFFLYLVFGDGVASLQELALLQQLGHPTDAPADTWPVPDTRGTDPADVTVPTEPTAPQPATASAARVLNASDPHTHPIFDEDIAESGTFEIIRPGLLGDGIVFHALPKADAEDTPGNWVNYSGTYGVSAKRFIRDGDKAVMLLKTADGYYVVADTRFIRYDRTAENVYAGAARTGIYGGAATDPAILEVLADDGRTVVFSLSDYQDGVTSPYLSFIAAEYKNAGEAVFEYVGTDLAVHEGTLRFASTEGHGQDEATVTFGTQVPFTKGSYTELRLYR